MPFLPLVLNMNRIDDDESNGMAYITVLMVSFDITKNAIKEDGTDCFALL